MFETAYCAGFDDAFGRISTGRIVPMTNDVFDTKSNSTKTEFPDDAPGLILCDAAFLMVYVCVYDNTDWIIVSSETQHMTACKDIMENYTQANHPEAVRLGNDHLI